MARTATYRLPVAFEAELERVVNSHNRKAYDRKGKIKRDCSSATRDDRMAILKLVYGELHQLGYYLKSPLGIKQKHVEALAEAWVKRDLSAPTLHKRFSTMRRFAGWIGKPGLVGELGDYIGDESRTKRQHIATENKAWEAKGVTVEEMIQRATGVDERFGLYLALQHHFGLRVKESIQMRPLNASKQDGDTLEVYEGTKGGRPRVLRIETEEQRRVVRWARDVALRSRSGNLRWADTNWKQAQRRFYNLMAKIGATKANLGVTAHGLRHGNLQREYTKLTGLPTPIEGGALGKIDWQTHRLASIQVAWKAGHGRVEVAGNYYGSYGHALRGTKGTGYGSNYA